jgi:3-hydroxyisobutyrate dehydrogenase
MQSDTLRVGQIGVGAFGAKVATRLTHQGYSLTLYDIFDMTTRLFNFEHGGYAAGSPKMLAMVSDVIVLVLPTSREVREAAFGWEGFARGLKPGGVVVDIGNSDADESRKLARELDELGIDLIDAPASGTIADAKAGRLKFFASGKKAAFERCRPVLEALGEAVVHVGETQGAAHAASVISTYLRANALLAAGEALKLAQRYGMGVEGLVNIGSVLGSLGPVALQILTNPKPPESMDQGTGIGLVRKELDLAMAMARACKTETPLIQAVRDAYFRAENDIGSGADHTDIMRWIKQLHLPEPKPVTSPPAEPAKQA